MLNNISNYFSNNISQNLKQLLKTEEDYKFLEEIRIRVGKPMILKFNAGEFITDYIVTQKDIISTLQIICENSIYSYQKEISLGFITVKGGHRVGITGNAVIENGKVINISYISSLNFRIARQILGCSKEILKHIITEENTVNNTLIVSSPGARKNYFTP